MKSLQNMNAVVTGASSGIGRETARLLAAAGCRVALLARAADKLNVIVDELTAAGGVARAVSADVTDEASVQAAFAAITREWGPVDLLINGAGVGFATDLSQCSLADYRRIMDTNMTGTFLCVREVLPAMRERKAGHIVNISSAGGKNANGNAPLYCASKFGINGYTSGLQQQVAADRVRVSLISPSAVDTAYWDGRTVDRSKFLAAQEVAGVIHFIVAQPDGVLIKDVDLTAIR